MATTTDSTLVAIFSNRSDAENAVNDLKANGFSSNDIYVGSYNDSSSSGTSREWNATHQHEGGIKGWFKSLFGEDDANTDYRDYETAANQGGVIVSVQANQQQIDRATQILQKYGPSDINEENDTAYGQGAGTTSSSTTGKGTAAKATSSANTPKAGKRGTNDLPETIPVVQEDLRIGKRSVLRGGVRVYSRVVETPVEETVQLREERVRVDRQQVNRPVNSADLKAGTEQVFEVEEYAEEPVVQKQARVVEEVRVSKDVSERNETVRDTVRRSEVQVEGLDQGSRANRGGDYNYDDDFRRDFQTRYGNTGGSYDDYAPAYNYGYQAANDPRYQGRNWDDVESDLRTNYGREYPNSTWDKMKDSIRYGWDKVTGRARGTAAGASGSTR
jgi:uncharacterized protein (TIGR02271 family)